ncbi:MAG TPA: hypothetical protein VL947_03645 [Cytophagales bacterium]|nr:hypothetical protein [Cytophagales bacterium]
MEDHNKIGNLFKSQLSDYKEEVSLMELELMTARMSQHNFMEFNLRYFNVYYAAAIFSGFLISLILGGHYLTTYKKVEQELLNTRRELTRLEQSVSHERVADTAYVLPSKETSSQVPIDPSMPSKSNLTRNSNRSAQPVDSKSFAKSKINEPVDKDKVSTETNYEKSADVRGVESTTSLQAQDHSPSDNHIHEQPHKVVVTPKLNKVVIYKRDTIYQYDTLKVKKKQK